MKLIHPRRSYDRGRCPDEAEPNVLVLSPVAAVAVPWTTAHRFDLLNHARHLF